MSQRPRNVCFTLNNPSPLELTNLHDILKTYKYAVFQLEQGANGTKHIQGFAVANSPTTFTKWKQVIGRRAHIEKTRGTPEENKTYCTKEDTRLEGPWEYGTLPQPGQRSDLAGIIRTARDVTIPYSSIIDSNPEAFLRYHKGILAIRSFSLPKRSWKTCIHWYYGPTGSGKSREANDLAPEAYWKPGGSKWWCGYNGNENVIIDDYRRDLCQFHELLRLFDRYPMQVETKGGSINFIAKNIYITTPYHPTITWQGRTEEDLAQLLRRIEHIKEFHATM